MGGYFWEKLPVDHAKELKGSLHSVTAYSTNIMLFNLVSLRLRSVKNIQKITKSMKMVSAAKFGKAERELRPARIYGAGASGM